MKKPVDSTAHTLPKVCVWASGQGSNFQALCEHRNQDANPSFDITLVIGNNPQAAVIDKAKRFGIKVELFPNEVFASQPQKILRVLQAHRIDYVVLAGFLRLVPKEVIKAYPVINIHPAPLSKHPEYGGKGMYGQRVFDKMWEDKADTWGMTIHWVNEAYDEGEIITEKTFMLHELTVEKAKVSPSRSPLEKVVEGLHRKFEKTQEPKNATDPAWEMIRQAFKNAPPPRLIPSPRTSLEYTTEKIHQLEHEHYYPSVKKAIAKQSKLADKHKLPS